MNTPDRLDEFPRSAVIPSVSKPERLRKGGGEVTEDA
jgi:hypothetical protein